LSRTKTTVFAYLESSLCAMARFVRAADPAASRSERQLSAIFRERFDQRMGRLWVLAPNQSLAAELGHSP
jgi:hypothetical protein